ncbi:broad substrate specificity ATP-binding cassette transporter ABCG2-like isoform X2 [Apostichopus japonicus]|uniref:broad substrate specificity ATP-binding cassette transporter ABCG2-like isoform X2 n=1 Tax=Stichopus japonicus TaxID=307972 RepID=UPI003AB4C702
MSKSSRGEYMDLETVPTDKEDNVFNEEDNVPDIKKDSDAREVDGMTLSFHEISYDVNISNLRKKTTKTILKNVSGIFKPGMNAILGPTGGGKTSLLDVLATRKDPQGLSGVVLINGQEQPQNFRLASGYVVQDDVIMGTLTVRENLEFSAALRLPSSVSKEEKRKRVDDIIEELGLTNCAETKIGTPFIRGVSGGERKRTNIGMELVTQPSVLFLDEPTTGLDATTAFAVIQHLSRLSKKGRTIIFSIHQPRYSIYRFFNRIHLLSLGETVYHGSSENALEYFARIGYICEEHNNPADFFLDTIIFNQNNMRAIEKNPGLDAAENGSVTQTNESLTEIFKKSNAKQELEIESKHLIGNASVGSSGHVQIQKISYTTSFFQQLFIVSKRATKNLVRNPFLVIVQNVILFIFAILTGLIYFQMDLTRSAGIQNRIGAFFFVSMQQVFANMSGMDIFIQEREIFVHESANGFYRVSPYYFGKVVCDLLPLRLLPTILFSTIAYWMMGLKPEVDAYFIYVFTIVLTSFVATGIAFALSSTFKERAIATIVSGLIYILSMIFGGVLVNISSLPDWIEWIQYLSLFRYTINALSVNEFVGQTFCDNGTACITGEMYLESQNIRYTDWGLWQNHVALFCIMLGFFLLAYVQLRRIPKYK